MILCLIIRNNCSTCFSPFLQNNIFKQNQKLEEMKSQMSWDQQALEAWLEESARKDEDNIILQRYMRQDEAKVKVRLMCIYYKWTDLSTSSSPSTQQFSLIFIHLEVWITNYSHLNQCAWLALARSPMRVEKNGRVHLYVQISCFQPFECQIIQFEFSPTWSCVSLTRSTASSEWTLFRFDKMMVNNFQILLIDVTFYFQLV